MTELPNVLTDSEMELNIAAKIVDDALALGYAISVYDGEAWALVLSSRRQEILEALNSTGIDNLQIRSARGEYVGVVALVWGNAGWELISDYTVSDTMEALLKGASELADTYADTYNHDPF